LKYGNNVVQSVVKDVKLDGACQTIDTSIYSNRSQQLISYIVAYC